jgi:type II secretory pathway component PulF
MNLVYTAFDKTGKSVTDTVEARDLAEATDILRRQGFYVTEIKQAEANANLPSALKVAGKLGKGKRMRNLAMFTRQLYVLLSTGTPMVEALAALERQTKDESWRQVIAGLRAKVEEGASMSVAMAAYPGDFNAVSRSLISAGESGGNLDVMLDRLASLTKRQMSTRNAIVGAMVYPALLIVVSIAVLGMLLTFVLPRFTQLFKTLDTPLPPTTKMLMMLSDFTISYWWTFPIIIAAAFFGTRAWLRTTAGKRVMDILVLKLPRFGDIARNFVTARIIRLLGVLLQGKVPLVEALELTKESITNHLYIDLIVKATDSVTRGESLAGAFSDNRLIVASVHEAMRSGERSGQLAPLLNTIADFLDEENEVTLRSLTSILEPLILIVLGIFVGFVAISMFMPLFDLTAATRGK